MQIKDIITKVYFFAVVDNIMSMLSEGLADTKNFALLDIVNPCIFRQWIKGVSPDMLQSLKCKHGPLSIFNHLKISLFFYNDPDFHKNSPVEILQYTYKWCGN